MPARRFTDTVVGRTTLGSRLQIRGSISGADSVYIAGQVEGPVEVDGLLHITESARVTGPITAEGVVIEGEVLGRIVVKGKVELCATARVRADIHAGTVAMAEGCIFVGRVHMGGGGVAPRDAEGQPAPAAPVTFREKRRRRRGHGHGHGHGNDPAAGSGSPGPGPTA
ncbi:MAG TPA: polymer-forming cytoskeletal protein [Vicinamibacteria bacterium]|nr:polymer-forming cytoskeletal protein [Vicinamibacteria bacterium]